ncbi:eukaryotic elongation factor 2 kinase-like isoform X3 [Sinocyclocheilus anshuiensis]|uniref:eukaryotic elongation factor 2 kinase-like isoform X3 n=1 Tax=Sinocyclocheilus anshuiensis TaxID=1608454 RepID=UPI0007B87685|nr:PREDICTED: eukaryotic elongation factor 2 kinase-like isoform X3 [Sinocyclocheilus anshuiensis]
MAEEELIFSMEEVGSPRNGCAKRGVAFQEFTASDDDDDEDDLRICPITDDPISPTKGFFDYPKNVVCNQQFSNSLPKNSFTYRNKNETEQDGHSVRFGSLTEKGRATWKHAIEKAKAMPDPWAEFHLEEIETERCTRYRYNAVTGKWAKDDIFIKVSAQVFGKGAMRECYRAKKLSNFSHSSNWKSASNYVAKRYMETVDREVYFEDVRLQMEAKLWGEEFNRHRPPKQVDIMQMCIVEMTSRPGSPLFHLEHYIEGKYTKYNSNSGFVRDDNIRLTPQAFSHFTFERSGHQLIVVDIQGVGDLYTDPQIHTEKGTDFGDGNLGVRGMALFFHSHLCNKICRSMGLTRFDMSPSEIAELDCTNKLLQQSAKTVLRGCEEQCGSPRVRTTSLGHMPVLLSWLSETSSVDESSDTDSIPCSPLSMAISVGRSPMGWSFTNEINEAHRANTDHKDSENGGDSGYPSEKRSEGDSVEHHSQLTEEKLSFYHSSRSHIHRPSCVAVEVERLNTMLLERKIGKSILGKVHLAMVRYHEAGRFCEKDAPWDQISAVYHLERAAMCGELEAIVALGQCYLQLPHHILPEIELEASVENSKKGFRFLLQAAEAGDRPSMILVARALDTGLNLPSDRAMDWKHAVYWYDSALKMTDYDEGGEFDGMQDEPHYLLLARLAEMYQEGGYNLDADPQRAGDLFTEAADAAMEAMKGRLANQYYMKAEEAWAMMEE